jgi:hypothetical protein
VVRPEAPELRRGVRKERYIIPGEAIPAAEQPVRSLVALHETAHASTMKRAREEIYYVIIPGLCTFPSGK